MVETLKNQLVVLTGISRDALHTQIGLGIFFASALLFKRRASSSWPIIAVLIAAVASEVFDCARDVFRYGVWDWQESIHDIINTSFWPTVLWVMARRGIVFGRQ